MDIQGTIASQTRATSATRRPSRPAWRADWTDLSASRWAGSLSGIDGSYTVPTVEEERAVSQRRAKGRGASPRAE